MKRALFAAAAVCGICMCLVCMGGMGAMFGVNMLMTPEKGCSPDLNADYKENYDPQNDDEGGLPMSSLIPCPVCASMYNAQFFKTHDGDSYGELDKLVQGAVAEQANLGKWNISAGKFPWETYKNHSKLYDYFMPAPEVTSWMEQSNLDKPTAAFLSFMTSVGEVDGTKGLFLFHMYSSPFFHGATTATRYDSKKKIGGFDQAKFDKWWDASDDIRQNDSFLAEDELQGMFKTINLDEDNEVCLQPPAKLPGGGPGKILTFTCVHEGAKNDDDAVSKDVYESLFKGSWPFPELTLPKEATLNAFIQQLFASLGLNPIAMAVGAGALCFGCCFCCCCCCSLTMLRCLMALKKKKEDPSYKSEQSSESKSV